jgi:NitT/TauT family transport system ATP-binding protein
MLDRTEYISIKDITVQFSAPDEGVTALEDVSLDVYREEFFSIIGPSGCGKSTLLNLIGGLLRPSSGEIHFRGNASGTSNKRGKVSYVFQEPVLLPWRTLLENVLLPLEVLDLVIPEYCQRARDLIRLVDLEEFESAYPRALSGGMKQRACIARALVFDPSTLLMDEPFGALDEITRTTMNLELQKIWMQTKKTILFVTHSIQEAVFLSDRIAVMSPRPGHLKAIVEINLPRPRSIDTISSSEFAAYMATVRRHLHGSSEVRS